MHLNYMNRMIKGENMRHPVEHPVEQLVEHLVEVGLVVAVVAEGLVGWCRHLPPAVLPTLPRRHTTWAMQDVHVQLV